MTQVPQFLSRSILALGPQGDSPLPTPPKDFSEVPGSALVANQDSGGSFFSLDDISPRLASTGFTSTSKGFDFVPVFLGTGSMSSVEEFAGELRQLRDEVKRMPGSALPSALERLTEMEAIGEEIDRLWSLPISSGFKASVGSFLSTGFLRGDVELLRDGLARCEQLSAYGEALRVREEVQGILAKIYPRDQRVGRKEAAQREKIAFLRAVELLSDEEQQWVRELLSDEGSFGEATSYVEVLRKVEFLSGLYDQERLERLFGLYGQELSRGEGAESSLSWGEELRGSVERLSGLEGDISGLQQLSELKISPEVLEGYRDYLLLSRENIERSLSLRVSELELEEWRVEWEEGVELELGDEVKIEESEELKRRREELRAFRGLCGELESLDFFEFGEVELFVGLLSEYVGIEREWVRSELLRRGDWGLSLGGGHKASEELNLLLGEIEQGERVGTREYELLEKSLWRVALWNGVRGRVELYEEALKSARQSDFVIRWGGRLLSAGLLLGRGQELRGAGAYEEMLGEYLKVSRLLLEGREEEAGRRFVMLETSNNHRGLLSGYEDSEAFKFCTLNAAIVLMSAGVGELVGLLGSRVGLGLVRGGSGWVSGVGGLEYGELLLQGSRVGGFWGNALGFTGAERVLSDYFEMGGGYGFGERLLLNAGMFRFLGGSHVFWERVKDRGLLGLSRVKALGLGARGELLWSEESLSRVMLERKLLGESLWVQGGERVLGYGFKLGGFGAWSGVEGMYGELKSGRMRLLSAVRAELWSGEAWRERALFLLSLELGGMLMRPLVRGLSEYGESLLREGYGEELELLESQVRESREGLESFLLGEGEVGVVEFGEVVGRFRSALESRASLEAKLLEMGWSGVDLEVTRLMLRELEVFEGDWKRHWEIFGQGNAYGVSGKGSTWHYDVGKRAELLEALSHHPSVLGVRSFENGLLELVVESADGKTPGGTTLWRLAPREDAPPSREVSDAPSAAEGLSAKTEEQVSAEKEGDVKADQGEPGPLAVSPRQEEQFPEVLEESSTAGRTPSFLSSMARGVGAFFTAPWQRAPGETLLGQQLAALRKEGDAAASGVFLAATPLANMVLAPLRAGVQGVVKIVGDTVAVYREFLDYTREYEAYAAWIPEDTQQVIVRVGGWWNEVKSQCEANPSYRMDGGAALGSPRLKFKQATPQDVSPVFEDWHRFFSKTITTFFFEMPQGDPRLITTAQFLAELSSGRPSENTEWKMRYLLVKQNISPEIFFYGLNGATSLEGAQYRVGGIVHDQTPRRLAVTAFMLYMRGYEKFPKEEFYLRQALALMGEKQIAQAVWQDAGLRNEVRGFFKKLSAEDDAPDYAKEFQNIAIRFGFFDLMGIF